MNDDVATAFKALGHPHRATIIGALLQEALACCSGARADDCALDPASCNVGELAKKVDCAPSTVSHHLKELEHAGLIERAREGRHLYCRVNERRLEDLRRFLETGAVASTRGEEADHAEDDRNDGDDRAGRKFGRRRIRDARAR